MSEKKVLLVLLGICSLIFFLFYPQAIYIGDEVSYLGRAYTLAHHTKEIIVPNNQGWETYNYMLYPYPIGVGLWFTLPLVSGGYVFLHGFVWFSFVLALFFIAQSLKNREKPLLFLLLTFFNLPCLVFTRFLMSEIPSLLLVSAFLFVFTKNEKKTIIIGCWVFWQPFRYYCGRQIFYFLYYLCATKYTPIQKE